MIDYKTSHRLYMMGIMPRFTTQELEQLKADRLPQLEPYRKALADRQAGVPAKDLRGHNYSTASTEENLACIPLWGLENLTYRLEAELEAIEEVLASRRKEVVPA